MPKSIIWALVFAPFSNCVKMQNGKNGQFFLHFLNFNSMLEKWLNGDFGRTLRKSILHAIIFSTLHRMTSEDDFMTSKIFNMCWWYMNFFHFIIRGKYSGKIFFWKWSKNAYFVEIYKLFLPKMSIFSPKKYTVSAHLGRKSSLRLIFWNFTQDMIPHLFWTMGLKRIFSSK